MTPIRSIFAILLLASAPRAAELPQFIVPGHETEMKALNELHALHHDAASTDCTLWDAWLSMATLWASEKKRGQYRAALLNRRIDAEGYVSMQQHRGMAHSEGWPFPAWQQSGGPGFHFSVADEAWAIQMLGLKPLTSTDGWEIAGAEVTGIDPVTGLKLKATADVVTLVTPPFRCGTIVAPFARIEWAARGLKAEAQTGIEWLLEGEPTWPEGRVVAFPAPQAMQYANVPLYRHPAHAGVLTRYRLRLDHAAGAEIDLKSIIAAIDTRLPITNALFLRGSRPADPTARGDDCAKSSHGSARCRPGAATAPTTPNPAAAPCKAAATRADSASIRSSSRACSYRRSCSTASSASSLARMATRFTRDSPRNGPHSPSPASASTTTCWT